MQVIVYKLRVFTNLCISRPGAVVSLVSDLSNSSAAQLVIFFVASSLMINFANSIFSVSVFLDVYSVSFRKLLNFLQDRAEIFQVVTQDLQNAINTGKFQRPQWMSQVRYLCSTSILFLNDLHVFSCAHILETCIAHLYWTFWMVIWMRCLAPGAMRIKAHQTTLDWFLSTYFRNHCLLN